MKSGFHKPHDRGGSKFTRDPASGSPDEAGKRLGKPESDPLNVDSGMTGKHRNVVLNRTGKQG